MNGQMEAKRFERWCARGPTTGLCSSLRRGLSMGLVMGLMPFLAGCGAAAPDRALGSDLARLLLRPRASEVPAGVARVAALARAGQQEDALALADQLAEPDLLASLRTAIDERTSGASESVLAPLARALDAVGLATVTQAERAEIEFARGLVRLALASSAEPELSVPAVEAATASLERAVRNGGAVGLAALRALADVQLAAGEAARSRIPEIAARDAGGAPPPGGQGSGNANAMHQADGKDDSDPLDDARALYLSARARYVERLALQARVADAGDPADARANAELVTRRLRELDEIERQREEQKQDEQDGDSGDPQKSEDQDPSKDPKDKEQESQEDDAESGENEPPDPNEPEDPSDPSDPAEEDPPADEGEETPSEDSEGEEAEPEPSGEDPSEASEDEAREITEKELTAEEQQRLLERNREYQKLGDEAARQAIRRRRIPAKRDW